MNDYPQRFLCKNEENWNKYKVAKQRTKKAVNEAKAREFENLYHP